MASLISFGLQAISWRPLRANAMQSEVSNDEVQALEKELVSEVNPTVIIGVFIAISTFFILASTMSTVIESFS